jgi:hypothetical protein
MTSLRTLLTYSALPRLRTTERLDSAFQQLQAFQISFRPTGFFFSDVGH